MWLINSYHMVNLEWYRTFKAIYQNGTLTRAAEELMISQPNVSIQLASLEAYIGQPLFIRLPRKMEPTEFGKRLYTQIVESIDNLERVESEFRKSVLNKVPTIRLGTPPEIFRNYMATHVYKLENIEVRYGMADKLTEYLVNGELDIAIITKQNRDSGLLTYEPLLDETFMIVCSPDFDTDEFDEILDTGNPDNVEKWLKQQIWYIYSSNLAILRRFWRENFKKRPILKTKAVIPDNNALLEAISNSKALAVSSDLIGGKALEKGSVKILWEGAIPATNTLYLAYNKNKIQPKQIEEMRDFIKESLPPALVID